MPVHRIAVLDDYLHIYREILDWGPAGDVEVVYFHDHVGDVDQLALRLQPFDCIVTGMKKPDLPGELLRRLPNLKLIVSSGPRNPNIDFAAAQEMGIVVAGTGSVVGGLGTVELAWALIFALARGTTREDAGIRAGGWMISPGTMVHGKTLGLVGLGRLGAMMMPLARAMNMRIVAWSRNLTDERAAELGVERLDREEFFATADFVSIHIRSSAKSRGYITEDDLRRMKPTAFLINTARAAIVDMDALSRALHEGWIAGAGLDVYEVEPLPANDPVRSLPRTVLSPHTGGFIREGFEDFGRQFVEAVAGFNKGEPIRLVDSRPLTEQWAMADGTPGGM